MDKPVEMMTAQEIRAELPTYQPGRAATVITAEEHLERRQALWRRLDELSANGERAA